MASNHSLHSIQRQQVIEAIMVMGGGKLGKKLVLLLGKAF